MAKFLVTEDINLRLRRLIEGTQKELILITPYLKFSPRIKELLQDTSNFNVQVNIVCREEDIDSEELKWLKKQGNISVGFCKNLHAKCYLNQEEAIVTSMNLHEYSQLNNNEMGIHVMKQHDENVFNDILKEANRLVRLGNEKPIGDQNKPATSYSTKKETSSKNTKESKASFIKKPAKTVKKKGHCIRCNTSIKLDPAHPLCKSCYNVWKQYYDEDYDEEYCHICGDYEDTSVAKPCCYDCYKENKNKLEFAY